MRRRTHKRVISACIILFFILWIFWYLKFASHALTLQVIKVPKDFWGVTFSKKYSGELGLAWRDAYSAILDDLEVKNIRLPIYWDDIEQQQGVFDYSDYDWMIQEGTARNVNFILVVGRRLPRWPECHTPVWLAQKPESEIDAEQLVATKAVIDHFKHFTAVSAWQIENEYFFPWFGLCPKANTELIKEEIKYVKTTDTRPVILTDSGELNSWSRAAGLSDILGVTMYRVVWNQYFHYFRGPWPAWLYRLKARVVGKDAEHMIIAELQAEPWPADYKAIKDVSLYEAAKSFNLAQFGTNSELARRTGFSQAYFWGVEWWYWMRIHGHSQIWDYARSIIHYANSK